MLGTDAASPTVGYDNSNNLFAGYSPATPGTTCAQIPAATILPYEDGKPHLICAVYDYTDTAGGVWKLGIDGVWLYQSGTNNINWTINTVAPTTKMGY